MAEAADNGKCCIYWRPERFELPTPWFRSRYLSTARNQLRRLKSWYRLDQVSQLGAYRVSSEWPVLPQRRGEAVFLSYASQDVEATREIFEALRQGGVEAWFDESELRG